MKKVKILIGGVLFLLIFVSGSYFYLSYQGLCFNPPTCTGDEISLCHPETAEVWQGPSSCSCGIDANILKKRGWIDCEVPEGYQKGTKREPVVIKGLINSFPKNFLLFLVPLLFLTAGVVAVVTLWTRKEEVPPKMPPKKTYDNSQFPK
jgi:hypothetical protein